MSEVKDVIDVLDLLEQRKNPALSCDKGLPVVMCFDYGEDGTFDRYTVIEFDHPVSKRHPYTWAYIGMSGNPFHPQGFGQHGEIQNYLMRGDFDNSNGKWGHLGTQVNFSSLPDDVKKYVAQDFESIGVTDAC